MTDTDRTFDDPNDVSWHSLDPESLRLRCADLIHQRDRALDKAEFLAVDLETRLKDEAAANAIAHLEQLPPDQVDLAHDMARLNERNIDLEDKIDELHEKLYPTDEGEADEPLSPAEKIRAALLTTEQVKRIEPPAALVDGLLYRNSLAMLYGPSGLGKSFLAADFALHVAYGAWWQNRAVTGGPVLYIVAEGASGFGLRIDAWERHNRLSQEVHPVNWLPWAVNIHDRAWAGGLAEVAAETRPALVVLDTFARCVVDADENSARDVGRIIANLDHVRRASQACVMLVHHSGKDLSAGARGNSALRGAMDTELELTGESTDLTLKNTKQKDAPEAPNVRLGLRAVDGSDSVVIDRQGALSPGERDSGLAVVLEALETSDPGTGMSAANWLKLVDVSDRTFYRHVKSLVDRGLIVNLGTDTRTRYRATSALENATDAG